MNAPIEAGIQSEHARVVAEGIRDELGLAEDSDGARTLSGRLESMAI